MRSEREYYSDLMEFEQKHFIRQPKVGMIGLSLLGAAFSAFDSPIITTSNRSTPYKKAPLTAQQLKKRAKAKTAKKARKRNR